MNMINVRRLAVMTFLGAGMLSDISAQDFSLQADTLGFAILHRLCFGTEYYDSQEPCDCGKHTD